MPEALVAGAFLSGFINVVFERFLSPEAANFIRGKKLNQELLERLKSALCAAEALLIDAEQKQINNPRVKNWLDSLRDAVYVADDLLDHVFTKAATQNEVSNILPRFLNFQDREIVNKMEEIVRRIEDIEKRKYVLGLKEIVTKQNLSWRTPSTSLVKGNVYGRENDQNALIKILLNDNSEDKISVVPIVGMGGVGKTTLAQWVYNNEGLMREFDLKAWVCVSEEFDVIKITKTVIEGVNSSICNMRDLNLLQLDLKQKLTGKKFFVVMDDVWSEDYDGWNSLITPFQYGMKGSKILVTTRSEKVASIVQACPSYHLNELSDKHSWSVFANHACFPESGGNLTLEKIGKEIVKKCKGLPLASQTLGGLLRSKHNVRDWNTILTSDIWELSVNESKIIPALRISYYHLPPHLKRCFVYCSLYPKNYIFHKDELILLWMAEDLLEQPKRGKTLEEVGSECFDELASRLFFKQSETYDQSFVMHDLMHDLAISIAGDFYFRSEELGKEDKIKINVRHLSYGRLSHPISKSFDAIDTLKSLRTFLPISFPPLSFTFESTALIILSKFEYLRVLSFRYFWKLDVLPESIGELIHLRYLDLSWTSIKTLPESLSNLYNLQTLKLFECDKLIKLPSGMQNLVNLRHLDIRGTILKEIPQGINKLKHLQLLSYFVVGEHGKNMKEVGELSNLHGSLWISKLENVTNSGEAGEARIMDKMQIENLLLEWSSGVDMVTTSTRTEREILDKLQPHKGLKVLKIERYRGTRLSDWVAHSSYYNMTRVSLESCSNCCMLPSLGQLPSLKWLEIEDFNGVETIGAEFYRNDGDHDSSTTPFPSLEFLSFDRMSCWKVWCSFGSDAFPQLKSLKISDCPSLMGDALENLEIHNCQHLVSALPRTPAIRKIRIYESNKLRLQELPVMLQFLLIGGCHPVECMFQAMTISHPTCLQSLTISDCSSAISFPGYCLPECLKALRIWNCEKLEFPKQQQHKLLESLQIDNSCNSLTSFPLETFPNLKFLEIKNCENMECLSAPESHVSTLCDLIIRGCPNFVSFPEKGLSAPSMTGFRVFICNKLKSLPSHMNTLLPKLKHLQISDCLEMDIFPEGGLPPNLISLEICDCERLMRQLASINLHQCDLTSLIIGGPCESVKSFPKEGLLPQLPSLTSLQLRRLSSLEMLNCKELLHITSLQQLTIRKCPKLENMAGERLPPSLIKLEINETPLLEERCKMKDPEIWPKIFHIPNIQVNWKWIT